MTACRLWMKTGMIDDMKIYFFLVFLGLLGFIKYTFLISC